MNDILELVLQHCEDRRWACALLPEGRGVEVRFDVGWTAWSGYVKVDDGRLVIRSLFPESVPAAQRPAVAEYLTRANWGLLIGNFEMDWSDGETRFKTSLDLNGEALPEMILEALFDANTQGYRQYVRGLAAVAAGTVSPEEAIADAEER